VGARGWRHLHQEGLKNSTPSVGKGREQHSCGSSAYATPAPAVRNARCSGSRCTACTAASHTRESATGDVPPAGLMTHPEVGPIKALAIVGLLAFELVGSLVRSPLRTSRTSLATRCADERCVWRVVARRSPIAHFGSKANFPALNHLPNDGLQRILYPCAQTYPLMTAYAGNAHYRQAVALRERPQAMKP
jgi:hypothetical protein